MTFSDVLLQNNVIEQRFNVFDAYNTSFRNYVKVVDLNYVFGRDELLKVKKTKC